MNHYMHLYGSIVIYANHIRNMVNLMLKARVRYLLYIVNAWVKSFNVFILHSWGNREALTISLTCLYPSHSEFIVTATDNHLNAK